MPLYVSASALTMTLRAALLQLVCALLCADWSVRTALLVQAVPTTHPGPAISAASGVALSADGLTAYVSSSACLYIIPLPLTADSDWSPSPWFVSPPAELTVAFSQVAASQSNAPQLVWLLDTGSAQLVSLDVTDSSAAPPSRATPVYDFGSGNGRLVAGMFHLPSSGLLLFSLTAGFRGALTDTVAMLDPGASRPRLQSVYSTAFSHQLAAIALSSTQLFLGTSSAAGNSAQVYAAPLPHAGATSIPDSTAAVAVYSALDSSAASAVPGQLVRPAGFFLNQAQSIVYLTDCGFDGPTASSPNSVSVLSGLHGAAAPLKLTTLCSAIGVDRVVQGLALSPDQSTLYFTVSGAGGGLFFITAANSSVPPTEQLSTARQRSSAPTRPPRASSDIGPTNRPLASSARRLLFSSTGAAVSGGAVNCSFRYAAASKQPGARYAVVHRGELQYSTASARRAANQSALLSYTVVALAGRRVTRDEDSGSVRRRSTALLPPDSFEDNDNALTPGAAPFLDSLGLSFRCARGGAGAACGGGQQPYVNLRYDAQVQDLVEETLIPSGSGMQRLALAVSHFVLNCSGSA